MTSKLVVTNGNVFNSRTGKYEERDIVIENGIIVDSKVTDEHHVIDATGKFILPGLIDCHVHLEATTAVDWAKEMMRSKTSYSYYTALKNALEHLKSGFTTLRDCGGGQWGSSLRHTFERGDMPGPQLLVAQRTIGQWGNQEAMGPDEYLQAMEKYRVRSGRDGVIDAVRDRKRSGSDFIKTMTTGGVLHGMESKLERTLWTEEELQAMVTEAHRLGMHVAVHAHGRGGIIHAAKAGVDTIEHCSFVDDEGIAIMKEKEIYLVPTQTSAFMDKPDLMKQLPEEVQRKTIEVDTAMIRNHRRAFEEGVLIACGTDAGVPGNPHGTSARELTIYVEKLGMSSAEAIQTATINAAYAIGKGDQIGVLDVGFHGNLIIVNKDPLADIRVLEERTNIENVVKRGEVLAKSGIVSM